MTTAIAAIAVFLLLITVHEFGHFAVAKLVGIRVLEFAVGMGPAIFKRQKGETLYSVRILPIGGYCKMEGEDEESDDEDAFGNKAPWKRFLVLVAGAFMNIVTGFVILLILTAPAKQMYTPVIAGILPGSGAEAAGLLPGDRIIRINNAAIHITEDLDFEMSRYRGDKVRVGYMRDGEKHSVMVTPTRSENGQALLGFNKTVAQHTAWSKLRESMYMTAFISKVILFSLADLVRGALSYKEMSGPVGIVQSIGTAASAGAMQLLSLTALISINLGVFNLLPFPALDGGRIFFLLIEAVRRKKIPADKEGLVHFIGFALLILLMIFATTNDIGRLIGGGA